MAAGTARATETQPKTLTSDSSAGVARAVTVDLVKAFMILAIPLISAEISKALSGGNLPEENHGQPGGSRTRLQLKRPRPMRSPTLARCALEGGRWAPFLPTPTR